MHDRPEAKQKLQWSQLELDRCLSYEQKQLIGKVLRMAVLHMEWDHSREPGH